MATHQEVIKSFMQSLDNTTLSGADALDEAVKKSSGGRFSDMQALIDSFINDVRNHGGTYSYYDEQTDKFLKDYCGIVINNKDTGAITGSDAGGAITKTAESIVAESGSVRSFPSGGKTTINGLTFHWPDRNSLSSDEQAIADRLYSWWAGGALNLIQESYGLNFSEAGTSVKDITLQFYYNSSDSALASVRHSYSPYTGKTSELSLRVNMYYYSGFDKQDVNGAASRNTAFYLDRTLAHEFVHAVMAANIDYFSNLPLFVKEGLAELVHGIDDERASDIRQLATTGSVADLQKMFSIRGTYYNYGTHSYAGGYMLFRYLAKQAAASGTGGSELPEGISYDRAKTTVTIAAPFSGTWDAKDYADSVRIVDASGENKSITIKAGKYNSTIKAGKKGSNIYGQGGNDTIYGGAGKDVFWYGTGDGKDTIKNFKSGTDVLRFYNKAQLDGVTTSGTNVILKSGTGSITLAGMANKRMDITNANGNNAAYYFGRQDKANSFVYAAGSRYYGSAKQQDTLKINGTAAVSLADTALYHDIDVLDASSSAGAVKLTGGVKRSVLRGGSKADTLTAGAGGAELYGGAGNDLYYGGKSNDKFWWGSGQGNDVVYNYEGGKDVIALQSGSLTSGKVSGKDVILTSNTGSTLTLKGASDKVIVTADAAGNITRKTYKLADTGVAYNANKTAVTIKAPFKGTWDAAKYASTVRTVDASQETNNITIKAGKYNNIIKAGKKGGNIYGQGGNDTIYGGAGKDLFWYGTGDGKDVIKNFKSGTDVLRFYNKAQLDGVTTSGTNVILKSGSGSITLTGMANKRVDITDAAGKNAAYYFGRQDKANSFVYASGSRYYGSAKQQDTLKINMAAAVSLADTAMYHDIDVLDASSSAGAVKLTGGAKKSVLRGSTKADTLTAGKGGAELYGGKGNDTYNGGKGKDKFWWGSGLGNDVVYNYESNKDIIALSAGSLKSGKVSGSDVILTSNAGNTLTLKNAVSKTLVVVDAKGHKTTRTYLPAGVTYNSAKTVVTIKAPFTGTWNASNYASTVRTVDASQETNSITIKAGKYNSTIKAGKKGGNIYGQGGNDTIYGGAGTDVFWYGTGDGKDTIKSFKSGTDVLRFYNKAQLDGVTISGTNVTLKSGSGSITLAGLANKRVDITDAAGKSAAYYFMGKGNDTISGTKGADRFYWGSGFGNDVISNYTSGQDLVAFSAGKLKSGKVSGQDVILTSNTGNTLTLKKMAGKAITIQGTDGKQVKKTYKAATPTDPSLPTGVTYDSKTMMVKMSKGTITDFTLSGNDVIFKSTVGDIRVAGGKDKILSVVDGDGVRATYKVAGNIPTGTEPAYNADKTEVILGENTQIGYIFDIDDVEKSVRTGNATAYKGNHYILWGSIKDDVLIAGSGDMELYGGYGKDTLYGGSGKNDFSWSHSMNDDVVYNYTKGQDRILLECGTRIESYAVSGNDVILKSGRHTLTVKDVKPGDLTVYNRFADVSDTYWYDGKLPDGISYNSSKKQYVLSASFGDTHTLFDFEALPELTASVDASAIKNMGGVFSIYGDDRDNCIIASDCEGYITTGRGHDTVYMGNGKDKLCWDSGATDEITVYGYKGGQDSIRLGYSDSVNSYEVSGNDLILWNVDRSCSSKLILKDTRLSDVTILDSYGNELADWQYSANIASEYKNIIGDSEGSFLYFDDELSDYVDADSVKLESISQNHDTLTVQREAEDLLILSGDTGSCADMMTVVGNASTTAKGFLDENIGTSSKNSHKDELLNGK
ncbi:calcium-binding protein [Selenomonas sp. KH1T6]|uniref:calcium-binding protein n=1 Tax=Selenomonas sp. KH1T6 TaxID=3158784 RepID=UPI0008A7243E|nr:Ca2+-binding protein, RTX toxin-related [Selenomonas ruminantium]